MQQCLGSKPLACILGNLKCVHKTRCPILSSIMITYEAFDAQLHCVLRTHCVSFCVNFFFGEAELDLAWSAVVGRSTVRRLGQIVFLELMRDLRHVICA
jgi:hypothetical protein